MNKFRFLSGNAIKIIGAVTMLIDHLGLILFPEYEILRIIGRIAFPLFAFMISEGARYTKSKWKYLGIIALFGVLCQLPMIILFWDFHLNVFVTFTLSIIGIYALDYFKKQAFAKERHHLSVLLGVLACIGAFFVIYASTRDVFFHVDYGFYGALTPVFASLLSTRGVSAPPALVKADSVPLRVICMAIPQLMFAYITGGIQYYSLIALIPLLMYSGKRGLFNLKYFFYIFYPAHLVLLYGIYLFI